MPTGDYNVVVRGQVTGGSIGDGNVILRSQVAQDIRNEINIYIDGISSPDVPFQDFLQRVSSITSDLRFKLRDAECHLPIKEVEQIELQALRAIQEAYKKRGANPPNGMLLRDFNFIRNTYHAQIGYQLENLSLFFPHQQSVTIEEIENNRRVKTWLGLSRVTKVKTERLRAISGSAWTNDICLYKISPSALKTNTRAHLGNLVSRHIQIEINDERSESEYIFGALPLPGEPYALSLPSVYPVSISASAIKDCMLDDSYLSCLSQYSNVWGEVHLLPTKSREGHRLSLQVKKVGSDEYSIPLKGNLTVLINEKRNLAGIGFYADKIPVAIMLRLIDASFKAIQSAANATAGQTPGGIEQVLSL